MSKSAVATQFVETRADYASTVQRVMLVILMHFQDTQTTQKKKLTPIENQLSFFPAAKRIGF